MVQIKVIKVKILSLLFILLFGHEYISAQTITLMTHWIPQSQFAGFYVAREKGFYKEEGLDVIIKNKSKNSTTSTEEIFTTDKADIVLTSFLHGLIIREKGLPIVDILQIGQNNPVWCISAKPIKSLKDFEGATIARWKTGYVNIFDLLFRDNHINVNWITSNDVTNLYLFKAVDAILVCSFNEYYKLLANVGKIDNKCILKASELGLNYPSEALFVKEDFYNKNKPAIEKFIRATIKGWLYAAEHEDEAIEYSNEYRRKEGLALNSDYHTRMMLRGTIDYISDEKLKKMTFAPVGKEIYNQIIQKLLKNNVISHEVPYDDLIKTDLLPHETSK